MSVDGHLTLTARQVRMGMGMALALLGAYVGSGFWVDDNFDELRSVVRTEAEKTRLETILVCKGDGK